MPCVMVNPVRSRRDQDVFHALGLRHGELLVGATDVFGGTGLAGRGRLGRRLGRSAGGQSNDLEAPAMRIEPVIGEVIAALKRHQRRLAGADVGLGRDLFCDL